jgi:Holliday junction resolvasome RuvABC ATP-dependent DNA helicase subunit
MGINEESIENEIEPLLLKRNWIEKTGRGRVRK